ncbi:MAG: winged helix-turn-helix domain-containing protein [Ilumatobacteraceae bacterium]
MGAVPGAAQTRRAGVAAARAGERFAARRPRAAQRPVRRLLPHAVPPGRGGGPTEAPVLAWRRRGASRAGRVQRARPQPRDLPGLDRGRPLDLTYMEYELLKFLAQHPGKVFTREMLLSRVWGYEYYGGARTVDVHIRRLRAKLGEEHANLIQTVRSVGYRFGQSRWGA